MNKNPTDPTLETRSVDQLTPERITQITAEISNRLGLNPTGARQVKFTNNAVLILPASHAVLRIAGSETVRARVPTVIAAAHWFQHHDIPAVRLWPDVQHPLHVGEHLITLWQNVPTGGPEATPTDLATILRKIHAVPDPHPDGIPTWQILEGMKQRLRHADAIDSETLAFLNDEAAEIEESLHQLQTIAPLIPRGLVHGDAHLGNIISSPLGPVICDFDSTSVGPREWDLIPAAVGSLRFNYPHNVHAGIVNTYGLDVTTWPGFPILRRLREFQLVTSVIPALEANPALRPQWQHRFDTYRAHDEETRWTPYADAAK